MMQVDRQQPITRPRSTFGAIAQLFQEILHDLLTNPFRADVQFIAIDPSADPIKQLEYERRLGLFRIIISSYLAALLVGIIFFLVFAPNATFLERSDIVLFVLCLVCLVLSYARLATVAIIAFLFVTLAACLIVIHHEIGGLNMRSMLIYSFVALLFVMAGMLLPGWLAWMTVMLLLIPTLISLATLPLNARDPRPLLIGAMLTLYLFAMWTIWLYLWGTSRGLRALAEAYQRERALSQEKETFINIASHELRNPLTPVLIECKLIERYVNQPERAEQVVFLASSLVKHVKRMDTMISMLLNAAQISLDKFALIKEPCDVTQIIGETVDEQQQQWNRQVEVQGNAEPIMGEVDGRRLWQVMTNLVSNALKYSPPGASVQVAVAVHQRNASRLLHVAISDTGPGIAPEALPHLFERHYRVSDAPASHQEGLGLGLYISATIVKLHGGTIWATSILGQGSTFTFEVPLGQG